jgi:hypothetical protein
MLYSSSYETLNTSYNTTLDFNQDNKIDSNDMNILWKYYSNRLTQNNYDKYITPNSQRKYLGDILDYINLKTMRGMSPQIDSNFTDYSYDVFQNDGDKTGSYSAPYITAVGLYSGLDLVAVAKLGSPIKITPNLPMNIVVKMDF